jgi:hypothetical protein
MGMSAACVLDPPSELTANTLNLRSVCFDSHFGQTIGSLLDIDRTSFSNEWPHLRQAYSYMGMAVKLYANRR